MAEYIERKAAIEAIKKERDYTGKFTFEEEHAWAVGFQQGITFALSDVANIPAADVRPVVKAQWDDKPVAFFLKCTECGCYVGHRYDVFLDRGELNFCPNCGADMREES